MEVRKTEKQVLQWHPAFYAGIQIELERDLDSLIFENEHQLGTKPKQIDVLIIKKEKEKPLHTNIGKLFRKYNIVEYKSPSDYLSIDDFYKVYGYACFYKSDTEKTDGIKIEDVTITLVCHNYPKSLICHWEQERSYEVRREEDGIYYIYGDVIPIQLILTSQLSGEKNFWLRNMTNSIAEPQAAERLIAEYEKHKNSGLYQAVMDIIVRANKETFEEVKDMCKALEELMKDELEACRKKGLTEGRAEGRIDGMRALIETCHELGLTQEETLNKLKQKFELEQTAAKKYLVRFWK